MPKSKKQMSWREVATTDDVLLAREQLKDQCFAEMDDEGNHYNYGFYQQVEESLEGDGTQLQEIASRLSALLFYNDFTPTAVERLWMVRVLERLAHDPVAARSLAGGNVSRGAPKKGARSMEVAFDVMRELLHGESASVTEAWELVANQKSLSTETVKKYWIERKPLVLCHFYKELGMTRDTDHVEIDSALRERLRDKRVSKG